jgi:pimeloyl-ACP methyl ester carboxylesterase
MPTIQISTQEIYYAARGSHGAPLVFIHGAGDSHLVWNGQLAALGEIARAFALDLPGHGRSIGAGRATILDYAMVVREFLDALSIERAVVVGISMGGAIAQTLALEFPERVMGLVLVGTGAKLRVAPQFLDGLKNDFENTARVLVENFYAPDTSPSTPLLKREGSRREWLKEKSFEQLYATGSVVTYNDFSACDAFDVRERISSIAAPTLVVCGRDDKMTPLKYSEFLAQNIPHARLVVIEHAGHMVMVEQDTAFGDALRRWLAALA